MLRTACFLLLLALLTGCHSRLERYEYSQPHMGTVFRVVLYGKDQATAEAGAKAAFARIGALNATLSDYDPESELSRLLKTSGSGRAVKVGDDLWTMLETSQRISGHTGGAFDITVGPVVRLWRRARRQRELPPVQELSEAMRAVGYDKIVLNPREKTATLTTPDMRLDLGGIAKGYACDEALKVLKSLGIRRAMVIGGGDVVAGDPPPGEKGWTVEIAPFGLSDPKPQVSSPKPTSLFLSNAAVSTSGDAFQVVEIGGKRYSHIVDPATGLGLTTPMGVSVIARDGTTADAYATALNVLGPERGLRLIDSIPHAAAVFNWVDENGEIKSAQSSRAGRLRFVAGGGGN